MAQINIRRNRYGDIVPYDNNNNRYGDMVPYDSNIVYLQCESGDPPSRYINASWVRFILECLMRLTARYCSDQFSWSGA